MVSALDAAVESVVSSLKKAEMWENTVFIFFSDNGGQQGPMGIGQVRNTPKINSLGTFEPYDRSNHRIYCILTLFSQVNYPLRGGKVTLWEGGIRSAGFVHSPMIRGGVVYSELMHSTDWLPTLTHLAACGVQNPACQGKWGSTWWGKHLASSSYLMM